MRATATRLLSARRGHRTAADKPIRGAASYGRPGFLADETAAPERGDISQSGGSELRPALGSLPIRLRAPDRGVTSQSGGSELRPTHGGHAAAGLRSHLSAAPDRGDTSQPGGSRLRPAQGARGVLPPPAGHRTAACAITRGAASYGRPIATVREATTLQSKGGLNSKVGAASYGRPEAAAAADRPLHAPGRFTPCIRKPEPGGAIHT